MGKLGFKMLLRSIKSTLGRYLAIMAIVALGVGFFAGMKSSMPAMKSTVNDYLREKRMYDFRLMSTLGFTEEDEKAFEELEGVEAVETGYFIDALCCFRGEEKPYQLMSLTEKVCLPNLMEGRMPQSDDECLADAGVFSSRDIGKTITVSDNNDEDTLDMFAGRSFTIVGLTRSPRYMNNQRGSTSLGSGKLEGFIILPSEAFSTEVYHELLLYFDFPGEIYSDEYEAAMNEAKPKVKELLNARGVARFKKLRAEADEELADARRELDDGWQEYYDGQKEAEAELQDALEQLNDAQKQIDSGYAQIYSGQAEINAQRAALPGAQEEIDAGRALLDEKEAELAAGRSQLESAKQELAAGEVEYQLGRAALDALESAATAPYDTTIAALEAERNTVQMSIDAIDGTTIIGQLTLQGLNSRLESINSRISEARAGREQVLGLFSSREAEMASGAAELEAGRAQIAAAEAQIADGEAQIADGRAQLDQAEEDLKNAPAMLDAAQAQLDASRAQLQSAQQELEDGRKEYEKGKQEAEEKLADGKRELEDAEAEYLDAVEEVDEKLRLDVYCLTRNENSGYVNFDNDVSIIDGISNIFPIFFALIAALVCVTTMTRMINDERTQIGTFKAMGYSSAEIMGKYLGYSGSSALLGCILGIALGVTAIPYVIWVAYNIIYNYTALTFYFGIWMSVICVSVAVLGTLLVTWAACRKELAEKPAELIRPKAPPKGKRILLERINPLWKRLNFLSKVTLRSAFRHPTRVLMMIVGIGGCTALMVAGFGARDSVGKVTNYQYDEIFLYDITANYDADRAASGVFDGTDAFARVYEESVTVKANSESKDATMVSASSNELEDIIDLHFGEEKIPFPEKGEAVISEKISDRLKLSVGDSFTAVTEAGELTLTVSGICKNYLNDYFYINSDSMPDAADNVALIRYENEAGIDKYAAHLRSEDGISYVSLMKTEREMAEQSMASLDLIIALLVVCSGALAFITLYNLTNINIMERTREIATVKVLGFRKSETAAYILRENLMLSVLGALAGLVIGKYFHKAVIEMVQVDYMAFDVRIAPLSYVLGFVITIVFAVIANRTMYPKLENVNMAESLKSVE